MLGKGKISIRSRNVNLALFAVALALMTMILFSGVDNAIGKITADNAGRYATSCADALSAHISREVSLMANIAHSEALAQWLSDEKNADKRLAAFQEMSGALEELYSSNLYIGVEGTRYEYKAGDENTNDSAGPIDMLDPEDPIDSWYFDCINSENDYVLMVAMDNVLDRKRVWLDYKVTKAGETLGVISTGLEFSHLAGELFSQYNKDTARGLIIGKNGSVYIDSDLSGNDDYLNSTFDSQIENELSDFTFLSFLGNYLAGIDGYFEQKSETEVIKLDGGRQRYAAIAPIRYTDWSAVIIYDSTSQIGIYSFLPVFAALFVLLIAFAMTTGAAGRRLIFIPLEKLDQSLTRLKENSKEHIYGVERSDELGNLANTIQDLFTKANYDALTGIYNRRFMEGNIQKTMDFLARSGDSLSVLMVDIDYFKLYNDTYGHDNGDACLSTVARALADCAARVNDFAARYGGEEFIAILPYTDREGACGIAQKLLEDVRELNIPHAKNIAAECVTVSVGVTSGVVGHLHKWEAYMKRADEALYMSKQNGRNQYTYLEFPEGAEKNI